MAGRSTGNNANQVREVAQIVFLLYQDFLLHILRCGTGPIRADANNARIEIWDHLYRYAQGSDDPDDADDQRNYRRQNPIFDDPLNHLR